MGMMSAARGMATRNQFLGGRWTNPFVQRRRVTLWFSQQCLQLANRILDEKKLHEAPTVTQIASSLEQ